MTDERLRDALLSYWTARDEAIDRSSGTGRRSSIAAFLRFDPVRETVVDGLVDRGVHRSDIHIDLRRPLVRSYFGACPATLTWQF